MPRRPATAPARLPRALIPGLLALLIAAPPSLAQTAPPRVGIRIPVAMDSLGRPSGGYETPPPAGGPALFTGLHADAVPEGAMLRWVDLSGGAAWYMIERGINGNKAYRLVVSGLRARGGRQEMSALDRAVQVVGPAFYRVTARIGRGPERVTLVSVTMPPARLRVHSIEAARGRVRFYYELPEWQKCSLRVLDRRGRLVRAWDLAGQLPGHAMLEWDERDASGRAVPPGRYLARLSGGPLNVHREFRIFR